MDVQLLGTGGPDGWPRPGCRCACCARGRSAGRRRSPAAVVVDGTLRIAAGLPPGRAGRGSGDIGSVHDGGGRHHVRRVPGGWDVTAPDGGRLLIAGAPGAVPEPGPAARPYDVAILDLVASPWQLGELRRRGLARDGCVVAAFHLDDRMSSEAEIARRCGLWGAIVPDDGDLLGQPPRPAPAPAARTLVLGGARSGKSQEAELRLAGEAEVTYLATAAPAGGAADPDWAGRIAAHRARRPRSWRTVESLDAAGTLRNESGAVLIDGIGTWLAAVLDQCGAWDPARGEPAAAKLIAAAVDDLIEAWRQAPARIVAVSDEVGSGVVPPTRSGRLFRDQLGQLNQRLAAESEEVVLVIAGRILTVAT